MILFMALSIIFTIVDTCAVVGAFHLELPLGVEPFWKVMQHVDPGESHRTLISSYGVAGIYFQVLE